MPDTSAIQDPLKNQSIVGECDQLTTPEVKTAHVLASRAPKPNKFDRISLVSTPFLRTPPQNYGGLELVVANLGRELARRGYEVTVFATENSQVEGCRMESIGKEVGTVDVDWRETESASFAKARSRLAEGCDIISGHTWYAHYYSLYEAKIRAAPTIILHTHHGGLAWPPYGMQVTRSSFKTPIST